MQHTTRTPASRTWMLSGGTGVMAALFVGAVVTLSGLTLPVQSARADSSSSVTIVASAQDPDVANAPFPQLSVTVSQTENLVSQGVLVSWSGGKKSVLPGTDNGGVNFLQIAQCWGDDPSVPAGQPAQPDRTTCQYGAFGTSGATRDSVVGSDDLVAPQDEAYTMPSPNFAVPTYTSIPFRSVTGKTLASVVDKKKVNVDVNNNEFFTAFTSNEIKWAGSGSNGEGTAKFEIQTALQAAGLGCGTPVRAADGTVTGQSCWLVVIPRGTADVGEQQNNRSGLFWDNWKHRIAFRLAFKPLGVTCALGAAERQIAGSELVGVAVAAWQPVLCNAPGGAVYTISTGTESDAVTAASGSEASALALTSRPLAIDPSEGERDPLRYAPIALSGVAISFSIDREPRATDDVPTATAEKAGLPFTAMKLTPRLVAKLLTNSYLASLPPRADKRHLGNNPQNLTFDPEFLAINDPEWAFQSISSPSLSDLLEPQGRSDLAWQLWRYVTSDKDAVDFLAGKPDPSGMVVNPWSTTDAKKNKSGAAFVVPRDNFPKADPSQQDGTTSPATAPINVVAWRPYTNDFDQSAYLVLRGDGQTLGPWDPSPQSGVPKYTKAARNLVGQQRVLGLTDTASAAKYQVLTASLLNSAGNYVTPTTDSLAAAAAAMTATANQPQVYEYDPAGTAAKAAPNAYPLAMPVYAAADPSLADAAVRADYAAFIRYAATSGQDPGAAPGQLPAGYAPLPQGWRTQALAAAAAIQAGPQLPTETTTNTSGGFQGAEGPVDAAAPTAAGATAGALVGMGTPDDPDTGAMPAAVPASLLAGFGSAAAVPLISRIRRRR